MQVSSLTGETALSITNVYTPYTHTHTHMHTHMRLFFTTNSMHKCKHVVSRMKRFATCHGLVHDRAWIWPLRHKLQERLWLAFQTEERRLWGWDCSLANYSSLPWFCPGSSSKSGPILKSTVFIKTQEIWTNGSQFVQIGSSSLICIDKEGLRNTFFFFIIFKFIFGCPGSSLLHAVFL